MKLNLGCSGQRDTIIKVDLDWDVDSAGNPTHVYLAFPDSSGFDAPLNQNYPDSTVALGLGYAILDRIKRGR